MVSFEGALGENLQILLIFLLLHFSQVVLRFLNEAEITEQDSLLQALPMRYRRVVDLHHMLGGESNRSAVRKAKKELKHLRVLRMAVIYMIMCVLNLYECAKKNSGPLRSTVWTMEVAMITIVGPVYRRYKGVPDDFLVLLDKKIDEAAAKFDKHAPPLAKQTVYLALGSIHKALEKIQAFVNKIRLGVYTQQLFMMQQQETTSFSSTNLSSSGLDSSTSGLPSTQLQRRLHQQLFTCPRNTTKWYET